MLNRLGRVFASFESHEVRYVLIGGLAAILHGVPRTTLDVDILIEPTRENAQRLLDALSEAGFETASLTTPDELLTTEITVFPDYVRVDVQVSTPGLRFEEAWARRETRQYSGMTIQLVSRKDLIASKRAAGRKVDLEDARLLESPPTGPKL